MLFFLHLTNSCEKNAADVHTGGNDCIIDCITVDKVLNDLAPGFISDMFVIYGPVRSLGSFCAGRSNDLNTVNG